MPDVATRTLIAPVRLRNAREHRRLEDRLRTLKDFANAIAAFDRGLRRHNARAFLRHAPGWEPAAADFRRCTEPQNPDCVVRYPRYLEATGLLTKTLRELRASDPGHPVLRIPVDELRATLHDVLRCRASPQPLAAFRRMVRSWTSRSCWKHSINGNRLCVTTRGAHGLKLRARLRQLLHADEIVQAIRLVRTVEGHPRVGPTRYALHVTVQRPADPLAGSRRRRTAIGIDTGARRTATDDTGQTLLPTADTATSALDRGIARKQRRSTGRRRALARRARQRRRTATRRKSAITRGAAILAREHAVIVVEDLDHGAMRSAGGSRKRGLNRTLSTAAPGLFAAELRRQADAHGSSVLTVPAAYTSRQCLQCASRTTRLTRTRVHCDTCGFTADRDHAAAGNILLKGAAIAAHTDNGPSGSVETVGTAHCRQDPRAWTSRPRSIVRGLAGTGSERRPRLHAAALERWGQPPPEPRQRAQPCNLSVADPAN